MPRLEANVPHWARMIGRGPAAVRNADPIDAGESMLSGTRAGIFPRRLVPDFRPAVH